MKKLLLLLSAIFVFSVGSNAQSQKIFQPIDTLVIADTIHYYYNKYYFKTATEHTAFPYYKSPAATATVITHMGSFFENSDTLDIKGLQTFASRNVWALPTVTVHLYLCDVDPATKMPKMPPLDSVMSIVQGTALATIGGTLAHGTKRWTKDFYVLVRNMSTHTGDTVNILRTAGVTPTNSTADAKFRTSEGFGVVRDIGKFYSSTNYTAAGFGMGTDYEFCVAPIVQYTLLIGHDKPWETNADDTLICAFEPLKFRSTCSKRISHRMYNLVEFRRRWDNNPNFHADALAQAGLPAEVSGITWHFMPEDAVLYYLPVNSPNGEIIFTTDSSRFKDDGETPDTTCFDGNEFRVRHYGMNLKGGPEKYNYTESFDLCTEWCNGTHTALNKSTLTGVKVYPNPVVNGKLTVSGLQNESTISAYNVLGQQILNIKTDKGDAQVDLSNQPQGSYVLKVYSGQGTRTIKIIKN